jgi:membrane-associated phospholipid phosphatase
LLNKSKYCFSIFLKVILLIIFINGASLNSKPQQYDTSGQRSFNKKYIASYWYDTKKIIAEPFHWKSKQWSVFAGVLGASVITYVYDKEVYNFFQRNRTTTSKSISKYAVEPWGSGLYSIPLLAVIYISGIKNNHHKNIALTGLKAYLLSGGAAIIVKHLSHRHRPGENIPPDPYLWEGPFPFTTDYTAFPSGHSTTAFAIASVLAQGYKDKMWVGLTSYTIAALVGISRIHDGKHWPTDVIAGAALGTFIGTTLSRINFSKDNNIALRPACINGLSGISLAYRIQ